MPTVLRFDRLLVLLFWAGIGDALSKEFQTGMTRLAARGGYSGEDKTMIYFILNRFQITTMKNIIRKIDSKAYIVISEVADVFPMNQAQ